MEKQVEDNINRSGRGTKLLEKIRALPAKQLAEVEDPADFLNPRDDDSRLSQAAAKLSEAAFAKVWGNPEDAAYDALRARRGKRRP